MNFMTTLTDLLNSWYMPKIGIKDIFEMAIIVICLYKILTSLINSRAMVVIKGLVCIIVAYFVAYLLKLDAIILIAKDLIAVCMVAAVFIFQPELRRFIERVGTGQHDTMKWFKDRLHGTYKDELRYSDKTLQGIVDACKIMSKSKTGALIVFEMDIPLTEYITSGIDVNGDITSALLINIFEKNTPLHDGAVIVKGDKVVSATCYLPLTDNGKVDKDLGTRHRAAIGVTEATDCFVITVSEETGAISFVHRGQIAHGISADRLSKILKDMQIKRTGVHIKQGRGLKSLICNNWKYKLLSLGIGVVSWVLLMNISNPITSQTFYDIPVHIVNGETITSQGKTYDLDIDNVDVIVSSTRSNIDKASNEDIYVVADLRNLTVANTVELSVETLGFNNTGYDIRQGRFRQVEIDELVHTEFNIATNIKLSETLGADNLAISSIDMDTSTIVISGAKKVIDRIGEVVAEAEITEYSDIYSGTAKLKVYDKNNDEITDNISLPANEVNYKATLSRVKKVPIAVNAMSNNLDSKQSVWMTNTNPESIRISGTDAVLNSIEEIDIPLTIDGNDIQNDQYTCKVDIRNYLPSGTRLMDNNYNVSIEVYFSQFREVTMQIHPSSIGVKNEPLGTWASKENTVLEVTLGVAEQEINSLDETSVGAYVNLRGLEVGKHSIPLEFSSRYIKIIKGAYVNVEIITTRPAGDFAVGNKDFNTYKEVTDGNSENQVSTTVPIEQTTEVSDTPEQGSSGSQENQGSSDVTSGAEEPPPGEISDTTETEQSDDGSTLTENNSTEDEQTKDQSEN